tara:strand:+ start:17447 stop:19066 length:1620 start_codon:yes stop_codon:yes gene_type:complete
MKYNKLKIIARRVLYVGIFILTTTILAYHNDTANLFFQNKINTRLKNQLKLDIYSSTNKIANFFDIKGKILSIVSPVNDSNIVDLFVDENKFKLLTQKKKKWIDADLLIDGIKQDIKLKLHGTSSAHYIDGKFSFRVKLKNNSDTLNRMEVFNLIKAEEADPTIIAANKLASNFGLISSHGKMIILTINNKNWGAYYLVERISTNLLEREFSITKHAKISHVSDWTRKENNFGSNHISDFDLYPGHVKHNSSPFHATALGKYKRMCLCVEQNKIEELTHFFDANYMGKYLSILALFNDIHHVSGDNFKLIYDFKTKKFYPIYRQESGSRKLYQRVISQEDIFYNNFVNFNKFIFNKSLPTYTYGKNTAILKALLSNDSIRNIRDKQLLKIVKNQNEYVNNMKDVYIENLSVLYSSGLSRRSQYFKEKQQCEVFSSMCSYAKNYLDYAHVYGSFNLTDSTLNVITDAFSQVEISLCKNKPNNYLVNGITFNNDLEMKYNYQEISLKGKNCKVNDIIFKNNITKDTIRKVYINELIEDDSY